MIYTEELLTEINDTVEVKGRMNISSSVNIVGNLSVGSKVYLSEVNIRNNLRKCFYFFFDLTTLYVLGQKFVRFLLLYFGKFRTPKFYSEIIYL